MGQGRNKGTIQRHLPRVNRRREKRRKKREAAAKARAELRKKVRERDKRLGPIHDVTLKLDSDGKAYEITAVQDLEPLPPDPAGAIMRNFKRENPDTIISRDLGTSRILDEQAQSLARRNALMRPAVGKVSSQMMEDLDEMEARDRAAKFHRKRSMEGIAYASEQGTMAHMASRGIKFEHAIAMLNRPGGTDALGPGGKFDMGATRDEVGRRVPGEIRQKAGGLIDFGPYADAPEPEWKKFRPVGQKPKLRIIEEEKD
jgi:hypothetical protein